MKKIYWTRAAKLLTLVIPVILFVLFAQSILFFRAGQNSVRLRGFYEEEENSLDVVFVGASDIFTGFSPAYAYDKFGFTSYMYALDSTSGALHVPYLKEVLKHQNPQLIVVEVHGYLHEDFYLTLDAPIRNFTECTPWSMNKAQTILDYTTDDPKLSYFVPFGKYHGEWKNFAEIKESLQYNREIFGKTTLLKGVVTNTRFDPQNPTYDLRNDLSKLDLSEESYASLMEFIDFCKSAGLENVIFVRFPHRLTTEEEYSYYQRSNKVDEIVTEHGFRFINLERLTDEIGIDYLNDYFDGDHLNIDGQEKLTEYLGSLIREEYVKEPVEQTPENRAKWEESARYIYPFNELARQMRQEKDYDLLWESPAVLEKLTKMLQQSAD